MANVTYSFDTLISVYRSSSGIAIGHLSNYTSVPHPGSGKTIQGWRWDERVWPPEEEFEALAFAPSIWDPSIDHIDDDVWQAGYGDNNDLLLLGIENVYQNSGVDIWTPKINHGYFYNGYDEWYLYSDYYQTEIFQLTNTISGQQYLDLSLAYKPTIPIQVRQYQFNNITGEHSASIDMRKVIEWDEVSGYEFQVDTNYSPPRLWLNGIYNQEIGGEVTVTSGVASLTDLAELELLGIANGDLGVQYNTVFSPIDASQPIEVWTWTSSLEYQQWTVISGVDEFTPGNNAEVRIDTDRGTVTFGDYNATSNPTGSGRAPLISEKIGIRYTKALAAMYEPNYTKDYVLARSANVNPVDAATYRGFVQVTTKISDPAYLTLSSTLPEVDDDYYIELGNNTGRLVATVYDAAGVPLEGIEVTFEILYPEVGTFGAAQTTLSTTSDADGKAKVIYNSPLTILDVGQATNNLAVGNTVLTVEGLTDPGTVSGLWLYKIHEYDETLGIPDSAVDTYYNDYLLEEDVVSGVTATAEWEQNWRTLRDLGKPISYSAEEIEIGKKTLVTTSGRSDSINPKTGEYDPTVLVPLYPSSISSVGTDELPTLELTYPLALDGIGSNDTKAYFVVGDAKTNIRAYCTVSRTKRTIYSNAIGLRVTIPSTVNGTYYVDALNHSGLLTKTRDVDDLADAVINETSGIDSFWRAYLDEKEAGYGYYSGGSPGPWEQETYLDWFRRTRRGDTLGFLEASETVTGFEPGLLSVDLIDAPGEIPLGFRLKSTGLTVASMLDQITYLDPNDHLPSGYWDV